MEVLEVSTRQFRDFTVTPALLAKLDKIRQEVKEGKYTECKTMEESIKHLESL
jgi:hypothetical protein